jgi:hypothetical protein
VAVGKESFLLRLDPETRKWLEDASREEGMSMSDLAREGIRMRTDPQRPASSEGLKAALGKLSADAARLAGSLAPAPAARPSPVPGPSSWDAVMNDGSPLDA